MTICYIKLATATCFGRFGHVLVTNKTYDILGRLGERVSFVKKKKALIFTWRVKTNKNAYYWLRINNQQDASSIQNFILSRNSTCFGHLLCPSSGVISCTRGSWYVSCRLCGQCLEQSSWNCSNLTLPGSGHITCMKHTDWHVYSW